MGDQLEPLISTYESVKSHPDDIYRAFEAWPVDRDNYYAVRDMTPAGPIERAAQFIYLNKTAWNGLYRVNRQGRFNVPFGLPKSTNIVPLEALRAASHILRSADLEHGDFETTLADARRGDLVFVDPPYVTSHNNNGFVEYNEKLFSWADQVRLATTCAELARKGVIVVATNAAHETIRELYADFHIREFSRFSTLAGKPENRKPVTEMVISSNRWSDE